MAEWQYDEKDEFYPLTPGLLVGQDDTAEALRQLGYVMGNPSGPSLLGQLWSHADPTAPFPFCAVLAMPQSDMIIWLKTEAVCIQWLRRYYQVAALRP